MIRPAPAALLGGAAFVLSLALVLWSETAGAVFIAMVETGFLLCQ